MHETAKYTELEQAQHRLEAQQARNRVKERKARTRGLIQRGAILEKCYPPAKWMDNETLERNLLLIFNKY
ncbi:MAG: DUF3847 domain-containing protein [Oscillospiraceae bacterium]|nr:DUF3847 domain-containing protein [Oscillospiraceae bacterium]